MLSLSNLIKISIVSLLIYGVACVFTVDIARAAIDRTAHWPVEVTSRWNAVYGKVTGVVLEDGDSVGMFDAAGNCYGAGLVRGGYYFLSAFMWEEADPSKAGDFTIPAFKDGDAVIFKAYKEDTAEEYILVPSGGSSYKYAYNKDRHNPVRIDLVYEETISPREGEEPSPPSDEGQWSDGGAEESSTRSIYPDELEWLYDEDEAEEDIAQDLKEEPKGTEEKISYEEDIDKEDKTKRLIHRESYDKYEPTDYYERRRTSVKEPSKHLIDRPSELTGRAGRAALSKYVSGHGEGKESIAEAVAAEPTPSKFKAIEDETSKKNLRLFAMIILVCIIAIVVVIALKKLNRK